MPALLVDTNAHTEQRDRKPPESPSPDRPPVSPITPTVSVAQLAPLQPSEPRTHVAPPQVATFQRQPPSVPISESDNPDAIALRSAISLLQLQREKSKHDLKTLEELKAAAVSDPQGFVRSIQAQRTQLSASHADPLTPTLPHVSGPVLGADSGADDGERRKDSADVDAPAATTDASLKFPSIPQPQNVIRCPPVNWAKYHIVGEPLDRMHEEQRQYPGSVEPPRTQQGTKAPPHAIAAPYSPFTDAVGEPQTPQPWQGFKKSPS